MDVAWRQLNGEYRWEQYVVQGGDVLITVEVDAYGRILINGEISRAQYAALCDLPDTPSIADMRAGVGQILTGQG